MSKLHGPCVNPAFYKMWLSGPTNPLYKKLFINALDYAPFSDTWDNILVPTMTYFTYIGRSLSLNIPVVADDCFTGCVAEILGRAIPIDVMATTDEARSIFTKSVIALLKSPQLATYTTGTRQDYIKACETSNEIDSLRKYNTQNIGYLEEDWTEENDIPSFMSAVRVMYYLASTHTTLKSCSGLELLTHMYISILKRGLSSDYFCDKINEVLMLDLNMNVIIHNEVIKKFYKTFGHYINDENIQQLTTYWQENCPKDAVRLRLAIIKAAGSGLTTYITIGRAMRLFRGFNWKEISLLFPEDWENYKVALNAVAGNVWYGFRKDLGPARSNKFKNLGYVAKELLIKISGESALNKYSGWTRNFRFQSRLDAMIAAYKHQYNAAMTENDIAPVPDDDNSVLDQVQWEQYGHIFQ